MPNIQYIRSRRDVAGSVEIRIRFYAGRGLDQQAGTGIFVPVANWSENEGRCIISRRYETPSNKQAREAQAKLDALAAHIYERYKADFFAIRRGWLAAVIGDYMHPTTQELPISERIDEYCTSRNVAPATARKLRALRTHLRNFATQSGHPLYASTLSVSDLDAFTAYLRHAGGMVQAQNSVSGRLRQLRTVVYWAGRPNPNPFDSYTIPADVYGSPIYLTAEERDYLYRFDDFTPSQRVQRDIFVFQCHVGCRVADLYALKPSNVRDGWLVYIAKKTSRARPITIEVPLSAVALQIIERYAGADLRGRLLPFRSMQYYNRAIQSVLLTACIDRQVPVLDPHTYETRMVPLWRCATSHTARKTFAQILYSTTGDKRLVASLTGHSETSQAFARYSEVSRSMKAAAVLGI